MPAPFCTGKHTGRPEARPVTSTGRPTAMAGRPVKTPCLMGVAANVRGQAGPNENAMGLAGPWPIL